ncbi:MAG: choice-of-anchor J domain-containing protein, partial [Muribaculaceae bacterium]|nr:choice-of-anchor J domain-containing protein [Muribaculaceae bacterium]
LNPFMRKAPAAKAAGQALFFEDFESWDGQDYSWLPDGFSCRHDSGREDAEGWSIYAEADFMGFMGGLTGNGLSINFSMDYLDEWIVFPEVTLGDDMVLSFDAYNDGVWYFSMDNVDWDTFQYVGEKELAYDQQVMVSEDGGETWTLLKSLADDFKDIDDFEELLYEGIDGLRPVSVSLSDYSGKTVRLAFRYVGTNGNTGAIDNISIGNPSMPVSYINPWGNLYFGMSPEGYTLKYSILAGPVYRNMMFTNYSDYVEGAEYYWDYFGPESTWETADTQDYLEVAYHTDYTNESTAINNLYYMPVLKGSAPGFSEGSFTRGQFIQAGGKGQFLTSDNSGNKVILDLGLSVIDPNTESMTTVAADGQPIFGYSEETDAIWSRYTFGDEFDDENYAQLDAYMDYFMTSENPIVIRGIHTSAHGRV